MVGLSSGPSPSGASSAGRLGSHRSRSRTSAWAASASAPSFVPSSPSDRLSVGQTFGQTVVTGAPGLAHLARQVLHPGPQLVAPTHGVAGAAHRHRARRSTSAGSTPRRASAALTASGSSLARRMSIMVGPTVAFAAMPGHRLPRPRRALRRADGGGRFVARRRTRPGPGSARPERRRQDVNGRDPGGLPAADVGDGPRPRARSRPRPPGARDPDGGDAPARRGLPGDGGTAGAGALRPATTRTPRIPTRCSIWWVCGRWPARRGGACRAASSSGCRWPWPWWADPRSSSSTSPPPGSTPRGGWPYGEVISRAPRPGRRAWCSPPTSCPRPSAWPTRSSSSSGGRAVARGTVAELAAAGSATGGIRFERPVRRSTPRRWLAAARGRRRTTVTEERPGEYRSGGRGHGRRGWRRLAAWLDEHDLPLADLRAGRRSLEEAYLEAMKGAGGRGAPEPR